MDVKDFNPRNLQVRAVEDNRIVVEGKYQQVCDYCTLFLRVIMLKLNTLKNE